MSIQLPDGLPPARQLRDENAREIDWLLAERRGPMPAGQAGQGATDFLIVGGPGGTVLPEVLRRLADFGLPPLAVKVHGPGRARGTIELRTDAMPEARVQRVARALLAAAGARRIGYRGLGGLGGGKGGVLVRPALSPGAAPGAALLPVAAPIAA
jgi:hypothetical protein